jgi:hypothetical protein
MTDVVSEESKTSGEAKPMNEAPAEPTEAQQKAQETVVKADEGEAAELPTGPSEEAKAQAREDARWRAENPNKVLVREANPAVGGESFAYLDA